jgi:hypothetical protein
MSVKQQQQGSVWAQLKALDAFPKVNEDFFQKTMSGGIITVVAACFMLILFLSETREFTGPAKSGAADILQQVQQVLTHTPCRRVCRHVPGHTNIP